MPERDATRSPLALEATAEATSPEDDARNRTTARDRTTQGVARQWIRANVKAKLFDEAHEPVRLGRFVIIGRLGEGGMGVVYRAYDPELDRKVAIKVLRTGRASDDARKRLVREARALAQLSHPNVVQVHEAGIDGGDVFVVMEFVEGMSVKEWCQTEPRPHWRDVLQAYLAAAEGLAAAHEKGLIHRDIKPANLLRGADGRIRVADFGLARDHRDSVDEEAEKRRRTPGAEARLQGRLDEHLTRTGGQMGTPLFMAPEQYFGENVGPAADQYGLCIALYEGLYGRLPFAGDSPTWTRLYKSKLAGDFAPRPQKSDVPEWLHDAIMRGLAPEQDERYPSMGELIDALRADPGVRRRARWRKIAVVAVLVLSIALSASFSISRWLDDLRRCDDMREQLRGVWDQEREAELRLAFAASGTPFAGTAVERVVESLHRYADRWVAMRTEVCEARRDQPDLQVPGTLHLREVCLERRRGQLDALVQVLSDDVDEVVLENAVQAVRSLPPVSYCGDVEALTARVRPPEDPALRTLMDAYRPRVDRLESLCEAGRYRYGLTVGEGLLVEMSDFGYAPLRAEAMYWVARLRNHTGAYEPAAELFREAIATAGRGGDDVTIARSLAALVQVVALRLQKHEEARLLLQWLDVAVDRAADAESRAHAASSKARVRLQLADYEGARADAERAVESWTEVVGAEHPQVARALGLVASVLRETGDYEQARTILQQALALMEEFLGSEHPGVATQLAELAYVERKLGRYHVAKEHAERALAIRETSYGPEHPAVARSLNLLGIVLKKTGELERAKESYLRSLEIVPRTLGPEHTQMAATLNNLANVLTLQDDLQGAREALERAVVIREKALGPEHPKLAKNINNLAVVLVKLGEFKAAEKNYRRALEIWETALGPEHPDVAYALNNLGIGHARAGDHKRAREAHERALAIRERALGREHPYVATSLTHLGAALTQLRQFAQAERMLIRARFIVEGPAKGDATAQVGVLWAFSELRLAQRRYREAAALLQQALPLASAEVRQQLEESLAAARGAQSRGSER